jgi:acetyltransferase-like isoleucine patch superfamily enzyme
VDPKVRRAYIGGYVIQIWLSLLPGAFLLYFYLAFPPAPMGLLSFLPLPLWLYFLLMPGWLLFTYYVTVLWAAVITRIWIGFLNIKCPPKEGVFERSLEDKDYVFWNRRNLARIFLIWLLYTPPFPWLRVFLTFNFLGTHVGKNCVVYDCWIATEFLTIGNNVKVGQGAGVYSYQFEKNKLIVARVILEDNVIVGPRSVIYPGVLVKANTTISTCSTVLPFSELEANSIYFGVPVEKIRSKKDTDV